LVLIDAAYIGVYLSELGWIHDHLVPKAIRIAFKFLEARQRELQRIKKRLKKQRFVVSVSAISDFRIQGEFAMSFVRSGSVSLRLSHSELDRIPEFDGQASSTLYLDPLIGDITIN
jgi:hypothetical protein